MADDPLTGDAMHLQQTKVESRGFRYQMVRYEPLPRAVVLCIDHNIPNLPEHIDVVELAHLANAPGEWL